MKNGFPYPLTIDFITLGGIATACTIISCIKHFTVDRGVEPEPSWIFGPHFLYKVKRILPIGFLFGIKFGVSGWGNAITPTSQHLLLPDQPGAAASARPRRRLHHHWRQRRRRRGGDQGRPLRVLGLRSRVRHDTQPAR